MAAVAFTQTQIYVRHCGPKEKDKHCIQCLERFDRNLYVGTQDSLVQHLTLAPAQAQATAQAHSQTQAHSQAQTQVQALGPARECRARKLGSTGPVTQLRTLPLFNHLLVLWERRVTALNMFSLEPVSALKAIQHTSCMEVACHSSSSSSSSSQTQTHHHPQREDWLEMVTGSSRRKVVRIHAVWVDRWEVLREVSLPQDPLGLAVDGGCVCVATSDRYLLCDSSGAGGSSMELFPHGCSRQQGAIAVSTGDGEFLLSAPGSLGMFVTSAGTCRRPPVAWPQEVLAAAVCLPYVLALRPGGGLSVYSLLDHTLKQTVALDGGRGLASGPEGVLVFSDRQIWALSLVPFEEQIQALVEGRRLDEALSLLRGVPDHLQPHAYEEMCKDISYQAGVVRFNQQAFSEAKELFIAGDVDPREIIRLYPDMRPCLGEGEDGREAEEGSVSAGGPRGRDLARLQHQDAAAYRLYLAFLADYLAVVRVTATARCGGGGGEGPREVMDCALLRLYAQQGRGGGGGEGGGEGGGAEEVDPLGLLIASPNACRLDRCVGVLEDYNRYFALGLLYQSHGNHIEAIKTWVNMADGHCEDPTCPDVYEHIVSTLTTQDTNVVWMFAEWALQKNQEVGVQIFTKHHLCDDDHNTFEAEEILAFLKDFPQATLLYLEFLIDQKSEAENHHTQLALAYVTQALQTFQGKEEPAEAGETYRKKLQNLLWTSTSYDVPALHERIKATGLHMERAIVLGRAGDHAQALRVLVHEAGDPRAAQDYCHRAAQDTGRPGGPPPPREEVGLLRQTLLLTLLDVYLSCGDPLATEAAELLGANSQLFQSPGRVVELLPGAWSVGLVCRFLVASIRETEHQRRMGNLQRALAQAECLRHKALWTQASKTMVRVPRGQVCGACQTELTEAFMYTPGGELLHTGCRGTQNHPDTEGS